MLQGEISLGNRSVLYERKKIDYNLVLFFFNVALVIIGYGLARPTGYVSVLPMKVFRTGVLFFSLIYLFSTNKNYSYIFSGKKSWALYLFIALNIYVVPFSVNFFKSLSTNFILVPFLIYINYFVLYLFRIYEKDKVLNILLGYFNIIYALPILSFIFFGGNLKESDIYGEVIGGFVANHYGWAAVAFLVTSADILRNNKEIKKSRKLFTLFFCVLALILLAISGSRSAYLSFLLSFLILILRNSNLQVLLKIMIAIIAVFCIFYLYTDKDSALSKRIEKTSTQLESGHARAKVADLAWTTLGENPNALITGFGFYAFHEAMVTLNEGLSFKAVRTGIHNSYYELLFGSGFFVFVIFLILFVFKSTFCFFKYHSLRYIFFPSFMIIPFFESNFNPGQFIFFPWFTIMLYYLHYTTPQIPIQKQAVKKLYTNA